MTTLYSTSFPGANEDPLSESAKWSSDAVNGAIRLITNAIATHSSDTDSSSRVSGITTPNANHWGRTRYSTLGTSNSDGGPAVRCDAAGNHYFLTHFTAQMHLFRLRGGGTTFEERTGGGWPVTTGMTANDIYELQVTGTGASTLLTALKNTVSIGTFTDSDGNALAAGGTFGVHMFDGGLRFNLFEGGDFASGGVTNTKVMSDNLVITDAQIHQALRQKIVSDSLVISDAQFHWLRLRRTGEDFLVIADAIVKSVLGSGQTYTKVMSDSLTVADEKLNWVIRRRLLEDALIIGDFLSTWLRRVRLNSDVIVVLEDPMQRIYVITGSDTIDLTDELVAWRRARRTAEDSLIISDSLLARRKLVRVAEDSLTIADGFLKWSKFFRVVSEAITIADSFSGSVNGAGTVYTKVMTDAIDMTTEGLLKSTLRFRQVGDAIALAETLIQYCQRRREGLDTVDVQDSIARVMRYVKVLSDDVVLLDSVLSNYMPIVTYDVGRFKLGADADPIHLGADPGIRLGGY